jgi:hypothetical protein
MQIIFSAILSSYYPCHFFRLQSCRPSACVGSSSWIARLDQDGEDRVPGSCPSSRPPLTVFPLLVSCHWAVEKDVGGGREHGIDGGSRKSVSPTKIERAASKIWEKSSMSSLPYEMILEGIMRDGHLICLLPCPAACSALASRFITLVNFVSRHHHGCWF